MCPGFTWGGGKCDLVTHGEGGKYDLVTHGKGG